MLSQADLEAQISAIAGASDDFIDPARLALLIGALDVKDADLVRCERHLDDLAGAVAARAHFAPAEALKDVVSELFGYRGDRQTYDDMQNANLIRVIERRRGLPVALGLLYLSAARAQGWRLVGLSFPGHFLLRLENGADRVVLDPFNDGRPMSPGALRTLIKRMYGADAELEPGFFEPVGPRDVVNRMLSNVRIRAQRSGDLALAAESLRRMTLVSPGDARLWAELGRSHEECGNLGAAKQAFERSLAAANSDTLKSAVQSQLLAVQHRLN